MDYYVADNISVPPSLYPYFSEKLLILPHSYQVCHFLVLSFVNLIVLGH
jgi:predicted O-linked N-acetylglucosamine transferase (SPINDLY family)